MVLDAKTHKPLHQLTHKGEINYSNYLASITDEFIMENEHPYLSIITKFLHFCGFNDNFITKRYEKLIKEIEEERS